MAITVKHSKVSTIPDEADTSLVRPSDWNADHTLVGTVPVANGGTGASTASDGLNALLPSQTGNNGKVLSTDGTNATWSTNGSGDVVGPASSTDNAIARFDLTTGKLIQNSIGILSDAGALTGLTDLNTTTATVSGQLNLTNASNYNLYASGAGNNYMAGSLGIGAVTATAYNFSVTKNLTGATAAYNIHSQPTVQSDVTSSATVFASQPITATASFTLGSLFHYNAVSTSVGAGSTITSIFGYNFSASNGSATNVYAFRGVVAAATGAWNLYMQGTAANYMAGQLAVGTTSLTSPGWAIVSPTQSSNTYQFQVSGTNTNASAGLGGLQISPTFTGTTSTANTFGLNVSPASTVAAGATYSQMISVYSSPLLNNATIPSTLISYSAVPTLFSGALGGTITALYNYNATATINASATTNVTTFANYFSASISSGTAQTVTNIYGFYGNQAAGTGRYNLYMAGTAQNLFSGDVLIFGAGGLGYTTGSGGAVTQLTSRTTGVTLNKTNGAITLVSAAGSMTYTSFTVTNSTVAATDTIIVNQKSGTDKYIILVTTVAAGSFQITFATTTGITTEQPVFNFAVIKAVAA